MTQDEYRRRMYRLRVVRTVLLVIICVLLIWALLGTQEAKSATRCTDVDLAAGQLPCGIDLIATDKPQRRTIINRVAYRGGSDYLLTRWLVGERDFLTGIRGCRYYGRYGSVRVVENVCGGRLVVHYRSVGDPVPVRFEWGG